MSNKSLMKHFRQEKVFKIDYLDLEELIKQTYDLKNYDIVESEEVGNDSVLEFKVEEVPYDWEAKSLAEFFNGSDKYEHTMFQTGQILKDMYRMKLIEAGTYLVKICW